MGGTYLLEMEGIEKTFPGVHALKGVKLNVAQGEIHALMGENGSGKSTLMKILMGICRRDKGIIRLCGNEVTFANPAQALQHGIAMIHQELSPVMDMEISENIFMGREIRLSPKFLVNRKEMREQTKILLKQFGMNLEAETKMRNLSVGQHQLIEIIRAVSSNAKIIIMDEPTSAITENEANFLFAQIQQLRMQGVAIIYISHKMEEIFKLADRITVLRDGEYIGTKEAMELDQATLVKMMVGRELSEIFPKKNVPLGEPILKVKDFSFRTKVKSVSFELRKGEIVGIAGLVGSGGSELVETIFGLREKTGGAIELKGNTISIKNPGNAIRRGIALITEDRKLTGLNLASTIVNNITIVSINQFARCALVNNKKERGCAHEYVTKLKIKTPTIDTKVLSLSGGNQQKVVISKWLVGNPDIIIMDKPTRGIDVGAKRDIYLLMGELVEAGKGIIMISSEMPELIGMCDRIIVLSEGTLVGEFQGPHYSQEDIMWCASGVEKKECSIR